MQRTGVVLLLFALAVGISLGVSFFLWGQPSTIIGSAAPNPELVELRTRLAAIEAQLRATPDYQSEKSLEYEDFEILLSRLDSIERQIRQIQNSPGVTADSSNPTPDATADDVSEQAIRKVYKDIKEEERRKQEEEWQKRREERWQETQEWLVNVYNERLALLTKELSLTPNQEVGVRQALDARQESVLKIYGRWQLPEEERNAGNAPSWDDINKAFEDSMKQILDGLQFKAYKDKHLDDFNRGRGRGRDRGR